MIVMVMMFVLASGSENEPGGLEAKKSAMGGFGGIFGEKRTFLQIHYFFLKNKISLKTSVGSSWEKITRKQDSNACTNACT